MSDRWNALLSKLLIGTVVLQASLFNVVLGAGQAYAAEAPVLINELSPSGDWVELFASRDVNFNDEDGWSLLSDSGATLSLTGTMTPGQYLVVSVADNSLPDDGGWLKLRHGSGDADVVTWGVGFATTLPGTSGLNTIARSVDGGGRWIANVDETEGTSNAPVMTDLPPIPSVIEVASTNESALNTINDATADDVSVRASFSGTAELAVALTDKQGNSTGIKDAVGADLDAGQVNNINASALVDGMIAVRAYTEVDGKRSGWATTSVLKDTTAPANPTNVGVLAGLMNGTNVINSNNVADVRVGADKNADTTHFVAELEDTLNESVSGTVPSDGSMGLNVSTLADGDITVKLQAQDAAGNRSDWSTHVVGKDTVLPAAVTDLRAHQANGYVSLSWNGSVSADIGSYRVYSDMATGYLQNGPIAELPAGTHAYASSLLPNGVNKFRVNAVDRLGNEEPSGESVSVEVSGALEKATRNAANRTLDLIDPLRLLVRVSPETKSDATLRVINNSQLNPTSVGLPSGHSAVGKYFELSTDNNTVFPLEIRMYYTEADLAAAGVANESQLEGVRYFDSASRSWKLYGTTGVSTANVSFGSLDFAGFVWAYADHLTPIVASADVAAPSKPTSLHGQAGDQVVKLTWDRTDATASYLIRYRQATNDNRIAYESVSVAGGDVTWATLKGFENGVLYEFGVASVDWVGNQSDFAVIEQTPVAAGSSADFILPVRAASKAVPASALAADGTLLSGEAVGGQVDSETTTDGDGTGDGTTPATGGEVQDGQDGDDSNGEIKGGTDKQTDDANTRTLVTILIIVIAAAAGFGGYYGYQWWMTKPEAVTHDTPAVPKEPEPKKKSDREQRGGRW